MRIYYLEQSLFANIVLSAVYHSPRSRRILCLNICGILELFYDIYDMGVELPVWMISHYCGFAYRV